MECLVFVCNINHCNDSAPCWDLDWTIKSYLILYQRNILANFRISSHKLEIEKGRYMNIPAEQRVCRLCKLDVENEIHFILECPSLANTMREILAQIKSHFSNFKLLDIKS